MGYQVLLTIDLPNCINCEREMFYEILEGNKWHKIDNLSTSWTSIFNDDVKREEAVEIIVTDLVAAKDYSSVEKYYYAFQLGKGSIEIGSDA